MTLTARLAAARPWLPLVAALALFLALAGWYGEVAGVWHEETSIYPNRGYHILAPPGEQALPRLEPSCADPDAPRLIRSQQRPILSLCAGGRGYPVMVDSYLAGWLYWPADLLRPLHGDDIFALRKLGLLLGALSLVLTFLLVRRLADARLAGAAALVTAASSCFAYAHGVLIHYEFTPWPLLVGALLALTRVAPLAPGAPAGPLPWRWLLLAALLAGASVAANIKTAFLIAPLALVSLWLGVRWRRLRPAHWLAMAAVAAVPLLPTAAFALFDPGAAFAHQVSGRVDILGAFTLERLARLPMNLAIYWTDMGAYTEHLTGTPSPVNWLTALLAWASVLYAASALARARAGDARTRLAAAAGAALLVYFAVVLLLYDQYPEANYAPLHSIFGLAMAATLLALARRLAALAPALSPAAAPALVALTAAVLAYNCVRRGAPSDTMPMGINAAAQRALDAWLDQHPTPAPPLLTTTYNLAGVVEAMGPPPARVVQANRFLMNCPTDPPADADACLTRRWRDLLAASDPGPLHVLAPRKASPIDDPLTDQVAPALRAAAAALGRRVSEARAFTTGLGVPVLVVYRVD